MANGPILRILEELLSGIGEVEPNADAVLTADAIDTSETIMDICELTRELTHSL
jgi:hypothetical protein